MPHSSPLTPRPGLLRAAAGWLLLSVLLWLPQVPPSQAAPMGPGWVRAAGVHAAEHFVGQYKDPQGQTAYCTDFERLSPENSGGYSDADSGGFVRSDGTALDADENAALSYLLHRWGATTHNATAASVQLAVWALTSPGMSWDSPGMNAILKAEALPAGVVAQARSMTTTAFNEAGPYEVDINLEAAGADGTISAVVAVLGAQGQPVAGLAAAAELTGPFGLADKEALSWTSGKEPHRLLLQRTGFGSGALSVTVPRTPAGGVNWLVPARKDVQRLLIAAVVEPRDAAAAIADLPAFQPTVTTRASVARTGAGTSVHDILTVSTRHQERNDPETPGPWLSMPGDGTPVSVEVISTLWGPLDAKPIQQESVPEGTPRVGTVATRVNGPGTYNTTGLAVPSPGWYVWTESIAPESALPADAAPYIVGWQGQFGIAAETTFVPWTPEVRTRLSAHDALVGDRVTDEVTGSGFGPAAGSAEGTVTLSMYGPLPERPALAAGVPEGTPLHSETTVPAANGTRSSEPFAPFSAPGCYTVVAHYAGDEHTDPYTSAFGEPSETVCVQAHAAAEPPAPAPAATPSTPTPDTGPEAPARAGHRAELAQTGIRAGAAAGAALILLGMGLVCVQQGKRRIPEIGRD